jgi:hypothetical protein
MRSTYLESNDALVTRLDEPQMKMIATILAILDQNLNEDLTEYKKMNSKE